jgi:hypothetical protein
MRPSLSSLSALLALAALLVFSTGCVQRTHRASGNRVALALTVNGTEQPNAEQWANVVAALKPELTAQGLVLVNDLADADRILRIDFTPSFTAPNSAGHAMFLGWRINPLRAPAFASASRTSLSYVNYSSGLSAYHNSPYGYDRYSDYGYGYSGGGSTASVTPPTAPPSTPPHKTVPPGRPSDDCPPGTSPPHRSGPGRFVGVDPDPHPRPGHRHNPDLPPPPTPRYPTSSNGSSSYSSSGGSSSSSSSSGSSSYSSSSSSFSSGSSSGVSGGSSSSSSYSPGSSGTHDTTTQKQN